MTQSDATRISEDRREALRYALAIGSGAALAAALASPAAAEAAADNTLERIRAAKVMRIAGAVDPATLTAVVAALTRGRRR